MNHTSTELWRKSEIVPIQRFPACFHDPIRKGVQIIRGELPDDSTNEVKESEPDLIHFTEDELNTLREKLGPQLVHGDYTLRELREIVESSFGGPSSKVRRG